MTDLEMFAEDATQDVFDATVKYGNPVSFEIRLSIFFKRAPPPVSTKPISTKSADNSGGVFSKASLIPPKI